MKIMVDNYHLSVMSNEVNEFLINDKDGTYVDATLGGGGHAENILKSTSEKAAVIAFDLDIDSINYVRSKFVEKKEFKDRYFLINDNFRNMNEVLNELGKQNRIAGILFDLGVSSFQLDNPEKGFSYREDAILDMRMDKTKSKPAYTILNKASQEYLEKIFSEYGEDKKSRLISRAIIKARKNKEIKTTDDFVSIIRQYTRPNILNKVLSRYFQALRIETNDELQNLKEGLDQSVQILRKGGRIVVISYHSLEDRIVKNFFRDESRKCNCPPSYPKCMCGNEPKLKVLTSKPVIPSTEEIKVNHRARSAKLRAAERI
jgi:16S rRNA (cytosine1402-N4)-methyltransferase